MNTSKEQKKYPKLLLYGLIALGLILTFFYLKPNKPIQNIHTPEVTWDTTSTTALKKAYDEEAKQIEAEKAAKEKEELAEYIDFFGKNWETLIYTTLVKGARRGLGGMKGLVVEVSNDSKLVVDEVFLDVYYIQSNGNVYKTEQLRLESFDPGEKKQKVAPDSERGRSVKIKLVGVKTEHTGFLTNKN
ncbi:hypothetical protein [Haliscomenobacter sp.]|uniref:hypothetical protein n=1 Tax=Haliscomenobacter sp. TaxID=2717303 RepID=UPI003BAD0BF0